MTLMKYLRYLAVALALICSVPAGAQMARLFTTASGLGSSQMYGIFQDNRGFIWIATENGLSRFDGMSFSTFRYDRNRKNSIASSLVIELYQDSRGTYWVGTSAGLQVFNPEYNTFVKINMGDNELPGSDMRISSITEIGAGGDKIVAASSGHGIYVLDAGTYDVDTGLQEILNSTITSPFIHKVYKDSAGRLWMASEDGGLSFLALDGMTVHKDIWDEELEPEKEMVQAKDFAEDPSSGNLIIATFSHGILIYDSSTGRIRKAEGQASDRYRVMSILPNRIAPEHGDHTFLIGLENNGYKLYNAITEEITDIILPNVPYHTSNWKVHNLFEDNQGNVWMGAYQTGVMVIPKSMFGFDYTFFSKDQHASDIGACITSIVSDEKEGLWIGTDGGGLYHMSRDGGTSHYSAENSSLTNNSIMSLKVDKRGRLWIATYLGGLMTYTPREGFRQFRDHETINTNKIISLEYSDDDDIIYAGTHGSGFAVIDAHEQKVIRTWADDDNKWISTLYIDDTGLLWVGTYNGPMVYDNRVRRLLRYNTYDELATRVHSFHRSSDDNIWIGTGEGLTCLDRSSKSTVTYSMEDGLPSNTVTNILSSNDGSLWLSTLNGLSRFDPSTKEFKNYYHYDGLQENEFHSGAAFRDTDGKFYFGGIKGISSFYPHIVDQRPHPVPPVYLSRLSIMNEAVEFNPAHSSNILDKHITEATEITLQATENIFSMEFSVLEYTNPLRITYAYRMEGFEKEWKYTRQSSREVTYTNLPHGRYKMQVKAFFEGEPETYSYRETDIRILPPWYLSFWAWLIYVFAGGLAVLTIYFVMKRHKTHKKEKEFSAIQEMKLKMFTNISHEIRTPLTLVMSPLKTMREAEKNPQQKDLYNLMYRNCLRILRLVNQLLDMRKIDEGQMKLHFLETDVVYFIRDIMQSFENLAVSRQIDLSMTTTDEVTNIWIDQGNFDKIIFNILSNAFKFTPDHGRITVSVSGFKPNDGVLDCKAAEYVEFTIENSGSIIEERNLDKVFDRFFQEHVLDAKVGSGVGLNLAKMLTELHHGDIRAFNTDNGVAFCIRIPAGSSHLSAEEMTKPSNHKDLYTKGLAHTAEHHKSIEDVTFNPSSDKSGDSRQSKSRKSIILVDDDSEMRAYMKLELQSLYNVTVCANGKEAWSKISTTMPDAVITDLKMEFMNGAELCEKIRKNPGTNHIPVILLTSSTDEESQQKCIDSGADRFFTKPVSLEILKSAIANVISTRETMRNKFSSAIDYGYGEIKMPTDANLLVHKVIEIIRQNIENPDFSVEELSHEIGMSRVHLNRKLKELMNVSPSNLIRSIRLKQAAFLLINNKVNISEVAYKVGFSTHSYFSNSFHDFFGMTPKEFVAKYMNCKDEETLKKIFE